MSNGLIPWFKERFKKKKKPEKPRSTKRKTEKKDRGGKGVEEPATSPIGGSNLSKGDEILEMKTEAEEAQEEVENVEEEVEEPEEFDFDEDDYFGDEGGESEGEIPEETTETEVSPESAGTVDEPEEGVEYTELDYDALCQFVYQSFENNPDLRADEIQDHLNRHHIRFEGKEVSLNQIRALKGSWLAYLERRKKQADQLREVQQREIEVRKQEAELARLEQERLERDARSGGTPHPATQYPPQQHQLERLQPAPQQPQRPPQQQYQQPPQQQYQPPPQQQYEQYQNPAPQPQEPPAPAGRRFTIPPRKTRLELLYDRLDHAIETGNEGLAAVIIDGIYAEYDKAGGEGGIGDKSFELVKLMMTKQLEGGGGKDPMEQLEKTVGIVKNLMPQPQVAPEDSENVAMAKVVGDIVTHSTGEIKDTILQVTGNKDVAELFGACPYCNQAIPKDSNMCPYCGGRLQGAPAQGVYQPQLPQDLAPPPQAPPQGEPMRSQYTQQQNYQPQSRATQPPPSQPGTPNISPEELKSITKGLKKIANFISARSDPETKVNALWKLADPEDKEFAIAALVIGKDRLFYVAERLAPMYPDLKQYTDIILSRPGRSWVEMGLDTVVKNARQEGFKVSKDRIAQIVKEIQDRIGFEIPDNVPGQQSATPPPTGQPAPIPPTPTAPTPPEGQQ